MDNSTFNDSSVGYPDSSPPSVSDAGGDDGDDANLTFVIEGVILSAVCVTGFAGNALAFVVMMKCSVREAFSNQVLIRSYVERSLQDSVQSNQSNLIN